MKTTLPRVEFADALAAVATLTGGRTTKPIYNCVKLAVEGKTIELSGTDGEAGLRATVETISTKKAGQTVVHAGRLLEIVRELSDVEITLEADDRHCTIRSTGSSFKIYTQNAADFPPVPGFDDDADLTVDLATIRDMIGLTLFAAARETGRYAINGVLWSKSGKKLNLVATDGRRLAKATASLRDGKSADFEAIVPSKSLNVFERVFQPPRDNAEWQVEIKVMPNQMLFRAGSRVLSTALCEGNFPDYQKVIPTENDKTARVVRSELQAAIRRANLLTTEESRAVRLAFSKGQLVISSESPEQGEARIEIPVEYAGPPIEIGFNPLFVLDPLKTMSHESVGIDLKDHSKPGVFYGQDKNDFLYVVMPVALTTAPRPA
ncbi:MAG: DNA polymerase III subunit beta [Phycisphaerales bacterium]|nr:DNA polymerase III subunit beta [Phycisphaerales bacterium]